MSMTSSSIAINISEDGRHRAFVADDMPEGNWRASQEMFAGWVLRTYLERD